MARVDAAFDGFEFGEATRELYAFFWNEFCDWYIEFSKARLGDGADPADRLACQRNLVFVLDQALRLLHPIMPFVTEEIYQQLPIDREGAPYLIGAAWPDAAGAGEVRGCGGRARHRDGVRDGVGHPQHARPLRHLAEVASWPWS